MAKVNLKYKLTLEPTITSLHHLLFATKPIDSVKHRKTDHLYEGEIRELFVTDRIYLNLLLGGFNGKWELEVWVMKEEQGDWKKLKEFPIKGDLEKGNQRKGDYLIAW
ncbi:MAG: hypothetical protein SFU99_16335 [Saprospiraceae bacterium]|nr:hypothetical protein [Saprospiraceae bacterium]